MTLAISLPYWAETAIKTGIILSVIPASALTLGYVFLMKTMVHMQSRLGPMEPGGFHGWYQLIGDGVKFIQKEDIIPDQADRAIFAIAPTVVLISTFLLFVVIPARPRLVVETLVTRVFVLQDLLFVHVNCV